MFLVINILIQLCLDCLLKENLDTNKMSKLFVVQWIQNKVQKYLCQAIIKKGNLYKILLQNFDANERLELSRFASIAHIEITMKSQSFNKRRIDL